jgi:hypothetical protein
MGSADVRVDRRPLLDTAVDADLFVGREAEISRLLRAIDLGLNAVVSGAPGAGTTSLLRRLAWCRRARGLPDTVWLSAADLEDPLGVLQRLLGRIAGDEAVAVAALAGLDAPSLIERIGTHLGSQVDTRTVVLLDDLHAGIGRGLFGALRDELWRLPIVWVVGVPAVEVDALLNPPVDAFFEVVVEAGPLSAAEAAELLDKRGTGLAPDVRAGLAALSGGVPRDLVDLARAVLLDGASVADLAGGRAARAVRLEEVSRPAAALATVLASVGAAGPSDPVVQQRTGVSRPRLVTLFRELRDAGLVRETGPSRNGSAPGRPKTRYVLTGAPGPGTVGGSGDAVADDR